MNKFIISWTMLILLFPTFTFAGDLSEVKGRIIEVQSPVPAWTPSLSWVYDQKWFVGEVIARIFDINGKIQSLFVSAFSNILTQVNNIPKWNGNNFEVGGMWDVGGNIGIGIASPEEKLHVIGVWRFDSGINVDGRRAISSTNYSHNARSTVENHYGYFEVTDDSGDRWAYFGYGDGENRVDLKLEVADKLYIWGGDVGIGTTNPSSKLEVAGKIEADEYCDRNRENCIHPAKNLETCKLLYRFRKNWAIPDWKEITLDWTTNEWEWSKWTAGVLDGECQWEWCGMQMKIECT